MLEASRCVSLGRGTQPLNEKMPQCFARGVPTQSALLRLQPPATPHSPGVVTPAWRNTCDERSSLGVLEC